MAAAPATGPSYKTRNFVNEHQEHGSEAAGKLPFAAGSRGNRYERQWPGAAIHETNASALAPTFSRPSATYKDNQPVSSISSDRMAILDLNCRYHDGMSVFGNNSNKNYSGNIGDASNSWQAATGESMLQQVVTDNKVGLNALRSPLVPTQLNQEEIPEFFSQDFPSSSEKLNKEREKRNEQELRQQQRQTSLLNHSLCNKTTIHLHHVYSHAQPTSRPFKSSPTSAQAQTQLNFSLNDYSTTNSDNNDNYAFATSDNWPTLNQYWPRRPPASSCPQAQVTTIQGGGTSRATVAVVDEKSRTTTIRGRSATPAHHRLVGLQDCFNENCLPLSSSWLSSTSGQEVKIKREASGRHSVSPNRVLRQQQEPSSCLTTTPEPPPRAICEGCKAASLRVSIRLPMKVHKIIIFRRPKVTFATTINQ